VRYLILSDIHSNWEALQAVLNDADGRYDETVCCGDLIGYGADPNRVLEWARANCKFVVRGNHDKACAGLDDLDWFNPVARQAAMWTHQELTPANLEYSRNLSRGPISLNGFQLVHGSPTDEDEYVIGSSEAGDAFAYLETRLAFFGHTHLQGGFIWNHTRVETVGRAPLRSFEQRLDLVPECAYLINPGSVGQPRDGDPRAAYLLYNTEEPVVVYRRAVYDIAAAQAKIYGAGLPPILGDRLSAGR
jgi:predicted phosphodiesterase